MDLELITVVAAYLLLYWLAGYFIAWQNPVLRALWTARAYFTLLAHTLNTLRTPVVCMPDPPRPAIRIVYGACNPRFKA